MKNLIIVLAILFITSIAVNGQDSFRKISIEEEIIETSETTEPNSTDLYDSIYRDFEKWYIEETQREELLDMEMQSIYNDMFENDEITKQVIKESEEDILNENIYSDLFNIIKKK